MRLPSKYKEFVYLISFLLVLVVVIIIKDYYNKIEQKEQHKIIMKFINTEFKGIIKDYERIPRGLYLKLDKGTIRLGIGGIALTNSIAINDSIVKLRGNPNFYVYKRDQLNMIYDTLIIESGY